MSPTMLIITKTMRILWIMPKLAGLVIMIYFLYVFIFKICQFSVVYLSRIHLVNPQIAININLR
jgi:hypothetical protein